MNRVQLFKEFLNEEQKSLTRDQEDFLNKSVKGTWKMNSQGLIDVEGAVEITDKYRTLKEFPVKFGKVSGYFYCRGCTSLVSLEGAPQKVKGDFSCSGCTSLVSLKGAPREVKGKFSCSGCHSLRTLEGAPQKVGEDFYCRDCSSLKSLVGAPREVKMEFSCNGCTSLVSLKGAPQKVLDFYCNRCTSVPQEELEIVKNKVLREAWLKSGLSFEEFKKQKKGLIAAKNFGF